VEGEASLLTVTKDLVLPTTVAGSWPRPVWYTENLAGRPLSSALNDLTFREQFIDANASVVGEQEFAGLDILPNGDYHMDADFAGRSWHSYALERLGGVSPLDLERTSEAFAAPNGTWVSEIMGGWRFPGVVDKIGPGTPLEYAKIWRIAQARASRPVKFGTNTADVLGTVLNLRTDLYDDDKKQLMWDIATVINAELRELVAAGCRIVQIEDPMFHNATWDDDMVDFLVDLHHHQVSGLEGAEIWAHACWGNPGAQGSVREVRDYSRTIDIYLHRLNIDVWQIESKGSDHDTLELFTPSKGRLPVKVAVGMISHRTVQVEGVAEIAADIRRVLEHIDAADLILGSDCGFGRQGVARPIAFYKAAALAQGANIVKAELGLPQTYVGAADAARQIDPSLLRIDPRYAPLT
jgi:5-methyltetrahydropteroyltriglutamate--homocysteine methyltransferase